ncbi:MAG: glycosyltransferase [Acidobacteriota bacterium]
MKPAAVVVNFNGGDDLPRCLDALSRQTVPVDVTVVDCASEDGSRRVAQAPPTGVRGVPLPRNVGFAGGCNAGLGSIVPDAEVIGFFNPDCFPEPEFFAACLRLLDEDPRIAGVAPRLTREDGSTLDSCGQTLTPGLLRVRDRGYDEPAGGRFTARADVLAACGAAMVYRRAALEAVAVAGEVFPAEFFAFWEDLDLGWRVSGAGWRVVYEPAARATHRRGGTAEAGRGRLIFRRSPALAACVLVNRWATLIRNLHRLDFLLRLPVLLPADVMMVAYIVARRPRVGPALARALPRIAAAWRARHAIVRRRLAELP